MQILNDFFSMVLVIDLEQVVGDKEKNGVDVFSSTLQTKDIEQQKLFDF
jgi:hypothetical protein